MSVCVYGILTPTPQSILSILGPVLFTTFVNDLEEEMVHTIKFVDDTKLGGAFSLLKYRVAILVFLMLGE